MTNTFKQFLSVFSLVIVAVSCTNEVVTEQTTQSNSTQNQLVARSVASKKFLFETRKAQNAGNADWVISENASGTPLRFPNPAISTVTSTTSSTYWQGALSSWGIALVKQGHSIESLVTGGTLTYGNISNAQDLSFYDVYVVDEPNILFTSSEKTAIINFVKNGGGLFMISDHDRSDRNNDGYDSPAIWNDLMQNNAVKTNPFGLTVDLNNFSETSSNVLVDSSNAILNGTMGSVRQLKFNNGASISINKSANATAQGLIWRNSVSQGLKGVMCASATYGNGRVVLIGDSSPADDGTGKPGKRLFPGWTDASGNHSRLHLNASLWLAKL